MGYQLDVAVIVAHDEAIAGECRDFRAALDAQPSAVADAFLTAPSPGMVAAIAKNEHYADETSYFAAEVLTTTLAKAYIPDGVLLPEANLAIFGARDLFSSMSAYAGMARAAWRKRKQSRRSWRSASAASMPTISSIGFGRTRRT